MYWIAAPLLGAQSACDTTCSDTNRLYDAYINCDEEVAYNQSLIDSANAFKMTVAENEKMGERLRKLCFLLQCQVCTMCLGVVLKLFT